MNDKKCIARFACVVILLLAISIPLQYLVRRDVVVGLPSESAHSHAHGEEGEEGGEEEGQTENEAPLSTNLISNYGLEVGTREQIWGWEKVGENQGAVAYRDDNVSRNGFASAAVNTNGVFVMDSGWYMKLDKLPRGRDVVFEGYVKTRGLRGEAYLRVLAVGSVEGQEKEQLVVSASSDDVHGDSDWALSGLRCYIPLEATGVWLEVGVFGAGQAWFDDLSLVVEEREDQLVAGENLLRNPSLEDGARNWHFAGNTASPVLSYGNYSAGPDGGPAFTFRDETPFQAEGKYAFFYQSICGFYGHKGTLNVSGWMRAEGLAGSGSMGVRVFNAGGETAYKSVTQVSGDAPWAEFNMRIPLDGGAADVWIMINLEGSGGMSVSGLEATFQEEQAPGKQ